MSGISGAAMVLTLATIAQADETVRHTALVADTVEIAVPPPGRADVSITPAALGDPYPSVHWEFERVLRSPAPEKVLSFVGDARRVDGPSLVRLTDDVGLGEPSESRPVGMARFGPIETAGPDSSAAVSLWVAWDIDEPRVLVAFTDPKEKWIQTYLAPAAGRDPVSRCIERGVELSALGDHVPKRTLVEVVHSALQEEEFDPMTIGQLVIRPRYGRSELRVGPDRRIVDAPEDYGVQWVIHVEGGRFRRPALPREMYATTKVLVRSDEDLRRGRTMLCN